MKEGKAFRDVIWQLAFRFKSQHKNIVINSQMNIAGGHLRTLMAIARTDNCTANVICKISGRDKAQITRTLKDLEREQLIQRKSNPDDKRSQLVLLSDKGCSFLEEIWQAEQRIEDQLLQGISDAEREQFIAIAEKMLNLQDD